MTIDLNELADRVEALAGPDEEVDALIRCALFASAGAYVKQSPINGAWCIYEIGYNGKERSWQPHGLSQEHRLGSFTASIDAAMTLVGDDSWVEIKGPRKYLNIPTSVPNKWSASVAKWNHEVGRMGWGATSALALTAAAIRCKALGAAHTVEGL